MGHNWLTFHWWNSTRTFPKKAEMIRVMETVLFCRSLHMCFNLTLFTACGESLSTLLACLRIDCKEFNSSHFSKLNIFDIKLYYTKLCISLFIAVSTKSNEIDLTYCRSSFHNQIFVSIVAHHSSMEIHGSPPRLDAHRATASARLSNVPALHI